MRRKDRQMDGEFGYELIDRTQFGVLSTIDDKGKPYGIPLSLVRSGDKLYFHSAKIGKKVGIFEKSNQVWVTFVGETKIPENYSQEELEEISKDGAKIGLLLNKVFTTEFESAMVKGIIEEVEGRDEKIQALKLICKKYTPSKVKYSEKAIEASYDKVNIYKIKIEELTAKRKKYDYQGKEIKKKK